MDSLILKENLVIPKGTKLDLIPKGMTTTYGEGNYEGYIATSKDTVVTIRATEDELNSTELFEQSK